jgi:GTP-dependent phosphoenolpyruvate carboxykinase
MRNLIVIAAILLTTPVSAADVGIVTLSFYKDSCGTFLHSEPSDQEMYLMWANGRITRKLGEEQRPAGKTPDSATVSLWIRNYCTANPQTAFVDATDAAKAEFAVDGGIKP